MKDPTLRNENSKVHWNIILNSPHAVAYKLWTKHIGEDWKVIVEGGLSDDKVDFGEFEAVKGTEFAYWFGIGTDKPQSMYKISIVLSQDSTVLVDGIMSERGRVNDEGIATKLVTVTFK